MPTLYIVYKLCNTIAVVKDNVVLKRDIFLVVLSGLCYVVAIAAVFLIAPRVLEGSHLRIAVFVGAPVSALLAIFLLPLIAKRIDNSAIVSSGRYHLPLIISGLLVPISLGVVFASEYTFSTVASGIISGFFIPILTMSLLVLLLCVRNIKERIFSLDSTRQDRYVGLVTFIASNVFVIAFFVSYQFITGYLAHAVAHAAYATAILALIGVVATYFGSSNHIPRFIRLEPPQKEPIKQIYYSFFKPFKEKSNWPEAAGFFAGAVAITLYIVGFFSRVDHFGINSGFFVWGILVFVSAFFLSFLGSEKIITVQNRFYIKIAAVFLIANTITFSSIRSFITLEALDIPIFIITCFVMGVGSGAIWAAKNLAMQEALMQQDGVSKDTVKNFYTLILVVAVMLAVVFYLLVGHVLNGFVVYVVIFAVLIFIVVASSLAKKRGQLTMNALDYITETRIAEDMQQNASVYVTHLEDFPLYDEQIFDEQNEPIYDE